MMATDWRVAITELQLSMVCYDGAEPEVCPTLVPECALIRVGMPF